ncbi:ROK family protein [Mongoliimonas terrestris]|uniref:ROK family protein n=1 Tax=Mongoliimonas terrestris TaxID=1709001 RepID=UPI000949B051|nr:ROK family protein [Mongoliimonas terrestris]
MLIGIDWGGTKMEVIGLAADGTEKVRHRMPTPREDYEGSIRAVVELVAVAETHAGETGTVGIGLPGSPNPKTGLVRNANSWWLNGKPLARDLEAALGRPVRLANDANCFAVSEAVDGAGAGARVVQGIILGTGHGSGIAIDGRTHTGFQGLGGEIGHYTLPWPKPDELPGPKCWCGRHGCLDMYCSGTGFQDEYHRRTGERPTGAEIIARMRGGDPVARATYEVYADRLARSLALLIDILDPDVLVLGGGMSNVDELYADLPGLVVPYVFSDSVETPIRKALHGDSSGVRGAAWLWKDAGGI